MRTFFDFQTKTQRLMNITFDELRRIKHDLPTGSVSKIAKMLDLPEQTVRNYFGAHDYEDGDLTGRHVQPGPDGGIISLKDTAILDAARYLISQNQ